MMLGRTAILSFAILAGAAVGGAAEAADAAKGAALARQWCANCHVIGETATGTVKEGPPSFRTIAASGMSRDQLRAFLSHPHGAMPDLALSRAEIDDLISYIASVGGK